MCSVHRLTEKNICVKFNENRPKSSADIERTRNCYGQNDGRMDVGTGLTDERHSYNPPSTLWPGINKCMIGQCCFPTLDQALLSFMVAIM